MEEEEEDYYIGYALIYIAVDYPATAVDYGFWFDYCCYFCCDVICLSYYSYPFDG